MLKGGRAKQGAQILLVQKMPQKACRLSTAGSHNIATPQMRNKSAYSKTKVSALSQKWPRQGGPFLTEAIAAFFKIYKICTLLDRSNFMNFSNLRQILLILGEISQKFVTAYSSAGPLPSLYLPLLTGATRSVRATNNNQPPTGFAQPAAPRATPRAMP